MSFDKQEFFKKQIEECRELESQPPNAEDRKTANFGGRLLSAGNSSFGELDPVGSEQRQREGPMVGETEN